MRQSTIRRAGALLLALALACALAVPAAADDPVPVTGVTLDESALALAVGEKKALTATVLPENAANRAVTWTSGAEDVAMVDADGEVTAVAPGRATITVTTADGNRTARCEVTVTQPVERVEIITPATMNTVEKGGTLRLDAEVYPTSAGDPAVSWSSSDSAVATVNADGQVTGVAPGKTTITAAVGDRSDLREIECSGIALSKTSLNLLVNESESLSFPCYGAAKGRNVEWSSSNPSVADAAGGRVTGHYPGTATITARVYGTGYTASCSVVVEEDVADAINCDVDSGRILDFSDLMSQLNSRCREKTSESLDYLVNLSAPTSQGILYYGYVSPDAHGHGVGGTEKYYYRAGTGERGIDGVSFVSRPDFSGTAVISYMGYSVQGKPFYGTIRVEVADTGDVTYSTASDQPLYFTAEEFTEVCQAKTGRSVKYLLFDQPSASRGGLYYNYRPTANFTQKVNSSTKYYTTSTPGVEAVAFLPSESYTGVVTVPYTCVDSSGSSYQGKITITVYAAGSAVKGDVEYTTGVGEAVELDASDFNAACREANGASLQYLYFDSLPASKEGVLYYNYSSKNDYDSKVSSDTRYYRNSNPRISNITFVPASGFEGTVAIPCSGYDSSGDPFSGKLVIRVTEDGRETDVAYSTRVGRPVSFEAADFNEACRNTNGVSLSHIRLEKPASSKGTLYYDRDSGSTPISESTSYYRTASPQISNISFVPKSGYTGTVAIPFVGYDVDGGRFSGTIRVAVGATGETDVVKYTVRNGETVRFNASDFNAACREITGDSLSYVRFELPASGYGALYYRYSGVQGSGTGVTSSTSFYRSGGSRLLDDVFFAAAPSYSGTVSVDYTGMSSGGDTFSGTVKIEVMPEMIVAFLPFTDIQSSAYYFDAVKWAVSKQVTGGTSATTFSPDAVCTRAQAVTFLWRAMGSPAPRSGANPFRDVSSSAYYYHAVLWAVEQGITAGTSASAFSPDAIVTRGQAVTFLYRSAGAPASGTGSPFSDVRLGDYYAPAVRWAVANGVTSGTSATAFSPQSTCTRAQIVTFLYRAMSGM